MGNTEEPLAAAPEFANIMMSVKDIPVLGVVIGAVSTGGTAEQFGSNRSNTKSCF